MKTYSNRTIARVVGIIYLAGFVVGIGGNMLIQSVLGVPDFLTTMTTTSWMISLGALLWLLAVIGDIAHGVLMFPILKQHSERSAVGYLAARIVDGIFIAIMTIFILFQIPIGLEFAQNFGQNSSYLQSLSAIFSQAQMYSYQMGMSALGVSGLILCFALLKAKLLPRWLAIWGLVGYGVIFLGMLSATQGSGLGDIASIPGGLWEVFVGLWLIIKGFSNPSNFIPGKIH